MKFGSFAKTAVELRKVQRQRWMVTELIISSSYENACALSFLRINLIYTGVKVFMPKQVLRRRMHNKNWCVAVRNSFDS